ncbi:hypothetical protein EUGRSUZ_G01248 [Eucalyptus grandis]|uniref:Uncharacterized protein n=2 Tax=Eucalyptus grandis TaxID=71139 RepID=A0ACC3K296_EUCGR|nr:hypothetical protein EUGRSUZ_G01248 [Eucalyptus grandis]
MLIRRRITRNFARGRSKSRDSLTSCSLVHIHFDLMQVHSIDMMPCTCLQLDESEYIDNLCVCNRSIGRFNGEKCLVIRNREKYWPTHKLI